jgi:hypothetical protein
MVEFAAQLGKRLPEIIAALRGWAGRHNILLDHRILQLV